MTSRVRRFFTDQPDTWWPLAVNALGIIALIRLAWWLSALATHTR